MFRSQTTRRDVKTYWQEWETPTSHGSICWQEIRNINLYYAIIVNWLFQRVLEHFPWELCWLGPLQLCLTLQTAFRIVTTSSLPLREVGLALLLP